MKVVLAASLFLICSFAYADNEFNPGKIYAKAKNRTTGEEYLCEPATDTFDKCVPFIGQGTLFPEGKYNISLKNEVVVEPNASYVVVGASSCSIKFPPSKFERKLKPADQFTVVKMDPTLQQFTINGDDGEMKSGLSVNLKLKFKDSAASVDMTCTYQSTQAEDLESVLARIQNSGEFSINVRF